MFWNLSTKQTNKQKQTHFKGLLVRGIPVLTVWDVGFACTLHTHCEISNESRRKRKKL